MSCNQNYIGGVLREQWSNGSQSGDPAAGYVQFNSDGSVATSRALTGAEAQQLVDIDTNNATVSNKSTLTQQAQSALAANRAYLGITSPTNAQVAAQVKALTQQTQALIRFALNQFDGTN